MVHVLKVSSLLKSSSPAGLVVLFSSLSPKCHQSWSVQQLWQLWTDHQTNSFISAWLDFSQHKAEENLLELYTRLSSFNLSFARIQSSEIFPGHLSLYGHCWYGALLGPSVESQLTGGICGTTGGSNTTPSHTVGCCPLLLSCSPILLLFWHSTTTTTTTTTTETTHHTPHMSFLLITDAYRAHLVWGRGGGTDRSDAGGV